VSFGAGVLVTAALVAALHVGGGAPSGGAVGLPEADAVTRWGLPVATLLARLLAVLTVGRLTFAALLVPADGRQGPAARAVAPRTAVWAATWLLAEAAVLLLTASSLYAVPVTGLSGSEVAVLLATLPAGRAAVAVGALLLLLVLGCTTATRTWHARLLLPLALGVVVVPVVLAGHSATADDHVAAVATLSAHVVTASMWVGGLVALLTLGRGHDWTPGAVRRFSALALACVGVLVVTGLMAAVLVAGGASWAVLTTGWAGLLVVKTVLLVGLAGLGLAHRRHTLPALEAGRPGAFQRLGAVEVVLMTVTVAVSVGLAASPPPDVTGAPAGSPDRSPAVEQPVPPAEDMSGHDHGELSVTVLVDDERFHVSGPVRPGQAVTVYNSSTTAVTITADDGSFDLAAPGRTFLTFTAPEAAGAHPFASSHDPAFADVLQVSGPD
jgi:putative copper export protein